MVVWHPMGTDQCGMKATGILRFYGFEHASLLPLENDQGL
jgi:hypothetical protein